MKYELELERDQLQQQVLEIRQKAYGLPEDSEERIEIIRTLIPLQSRLIQIIEKLGGINDLDY